MKTTAISTVVALGFLCAVAGGQPPNLDALLAKAGQWDYDQNREPVRAVSDAIQKAQGSSATLREIETRFIAFLKSGATPASKDFICRQLSLMGSAASVPVLSTILVQASTAEVARFALERIPGAEADRALRDALAKSSGNTRIGIINTLGWRGDAGAVAALGPLTSAPDQSTAAAALAALAAIADPAAVQALGAIFGKTSGAAHVSAAEACLKAADNLVARGDKAAAAPLYKKLYAAAEPPVVRAGALHGIIATDAQPTAVLMEALRGDDTRLQAIAIGALARGGSVKQLLAEMPKLSEASRVRVLGTLSEHRQGGVLPAFTESLNDKSGPVRLAGLDGIGVVGDASVIPLVAAVAVGGDEAERTAARNALGRIPGKDVDRKFVEGLTGGEPKIRLELIRAAGARGTPAASPALLKLSRDTDDDVRRESIRALRTTAASADVAGLVALLVSPTRPGDRAEVVRSLGTVVRRSDPACVQDLVSAYTATGEAEARAALLQVLGQSGDARALAILRGALKEDNPDLKRGAILALTDWPDATPLPDLFEASRAASNPAHRVLALRGFVKLIGLLVPARSPGESVKLLADAMSLAKGVEEKRAVLAMLPRYPTPEALALATASLNDSQVTEEAKSAVGRIERTLKR